MYLLAFSYLADLLFGDPEWFPHPVRLIGNFIKFLEKILRRKSQGLSRNAVRVKGALLALLVVALSSFCSFLFIFFMQYLNRYLGYAAGIFVAYTTLSVKDLRVKADHVLNSLEKGDLAGARKHLSRIVGRDTENLSEEDVARAVIECVSESTCDGIIAPLFYLIIGGPVLAIAYKSINTLDSMVAYKNDAYCDLGWFSAKLDDFANFIPARITGVLISASSAITGKNFVRALNMMIRDGRKHPSPNSGISEAAMAGALGIRIGGTSTYQGIVSEKPFIGDAIAGIKTSMVNESLKISFIASLIMVLSGALIKWVH